jgi:hypothetical protein
MSQTRHKETRGSQQKSVPKLPPIPERVETKVKPRRKSDGDQIDATEGLGVADRTWAIGIDAALARFSLRISRSSSDLILIQHDDALPTSAISRLSALRRYC